jgi:hypothetical protein
MFDTTPEIKSALSGYPEQRTPCSHVDCNSIHLAVDCVHRQTCVTVISTNHLLSAISFRRLTLIGQAIKITIIQHNVISEIFGAVIGMSSLGVCHRVVARQGDMCIYISENIMLRGAASTLPNIIIIIIIIIIVKNFNQYALSLNYLNSEICSQLRRKMTTNFGKHV